MVKEITNPGCDTEIHYVSVPSTGQNALIKTINEGNQVNLLLFGIETLWKLWKLHQEELICSL